MNLINRWYITMLFGVITAPVGIVLYLICDRSNLENEYYIYGCRNDVEIDAYYVKNINHIDYIKSKNGYNKKLGMYVFFVPKDAVVYYLDTIDLEIVKFKAIYIRNSYKEFKVIGYANIENIHRFQKRCNEKYYENNPRTSRSATVRNE